MKIGDNNVIESKGNAASHLYLWLCLYISILCVLVEIFVDLKFNWMGDKIKENETVTRTSEHLSRLLLILWRKDSPFCVYHIIPSDPSVLIAEVGRNVILTSGCIIGACCRLNTCEEIPENTVIYSSNCMRRVQTERPQVTHRNTAGSLKLCAFFLLTYF